MVRQPSLVARCSQQRGARPYCGSLNDAAGQTPQTTCPRAAITSALRGAPAARTRTASAATSGCCRERASAPVSTALGVLGMPGQTAHGGMVDVCRPKPGETVAISAAAGAVGSIAGQIGKILGARVVGIAGGPAKCQALLDLGFDAAADYKSPDFAAQLKAACPNGIDAYFDNTGGAVTLEVFKHLNRGSRMAMCGYIAYYGMGYEGPGPDHLPALYRTIMATGMTVAFGQDCCMDPWYSMGSGDMLEVASMGLHVAQMTSQAAMQQCFDAVTKNPARILHLDGYGLEAGCHADLVLLQAHNPIEAIRLKATRLKVWRRGALVAQTPARTAALSLPGRPIQTSFLHVK